MNQNFQHGDDEQPIPLTPPDVLLLAADTVYGDPRETTQDGQRKAQFVIDSILSAAIAGGFKYEQTLRALMKLNRPTQLMLELARSACKAAGDPALRKVFDQAGL